MNTENISKQVIVVRKDLNMRKGKIAAQAAHASIAFLTSQIRNVSVDEHEQGWDGNGSPVMERPATMMKRTVMLDAESASWIDGPFTKVVVYVTSEEELLAVHKAATDAGCRSHLIQDAGRTEFNGVPTYTCVAVGPNYISKVDAVTKSLSLL